MQLARELNRVVPGTVDSWAGTMPDGSGSDRVGPSADAGTTGDCERVPERRSAPGGVTDVAEGPASKPAAPDVADIAEAAQELLAGLPTGGLDPARATFLRGQLTALETRARLADGTVLPFRELVRALFDVDLRPGDPSTYARAHAELDALLPGSGDLAQRYEAFRVDTRIDAALLPAAIEAVLAELRARTQQVLGLPDGERVVAEVVRDRPWAGFNTYGPDLTSTVSINADLPISAGSLFVLLAHEAYPGHHTDRVRTQTSAPDRPEASIWLSGAPENVLAEGLAELALSGIGLERWGPVARETYAGIGLDVDGELAEAVARAAAPLSAVRQDVALLLHASRDVPAAERHLARWSVQTPERRAKTLAFLSDPAQPGYVVTYVEGERLVREWLAAGPVALRYARLLDEQLTPGQLRAELGR